MRRSALFIALAVAAAAPISAAPLQHKTGPQHKTGEEKLQELLKDRVAGKPVSCLSLPALRDSQIIDGTAIVYRSGSKLYVNRPRSDAKWLNSDDILLTRTSGGDLCSIDTVYLLDRDTHFTRGFVTLGDFVPYERVRGGK
jgi:hypothetical protein